MHLTTIEKRMKKKMPIRSRARVPLLTVAVALLTPVAGERIALADEAITLDAAVERALARAPEVRAARASRAAAEERTGQARSTYWPRLGLEVSYAIKSMKNELPLDLPSFLNITIPDIDDYHRFRAGAQVAMSLLDFSRGPRLDSTKLGTEAEEARQRETEAGLAFQVRGVFLAALLAGEIEKIAGESLEVATAEAKREDLRATVGTGSQLALAQARVRVAGLHAQLQQAENEHRRQLDQLASLLGLGGAPSLAGSLETLARGGEGVGGAIRSSPTVKRLEVSAAAARLVAKSTSRAFLPTLSLMAKAEVEYPHGFKLEWGPLVQAGATASWTFFDGLYRGARERESLADAKGLEELAEATRQQLQRKLIDLESRRKTAATDLTAALETHTQSEIYLRVAKAAWEAGTGTHLEVGNAELALDNARIAVTRANFAAAMVKAEILLAVGASREAGSSR
jgi:outer membrane protein TolC